MIRDKNVLITGGGGFIGSHVAEKLDEANRVSVLDDFSTGARSNVPFLPADRIYDGSVTDEELVRSAVQDTDIVLHLAAMMGVKRTLERPLEVLKVNIDGTRTLLRAATEADVDRVLFASTSEVYGDDPDPPYHEDDVTAPLTNYAVAKLTDERFVRSYQQRFELDYTIVRYFNVYGPRQDSSSYGYVVPKFVDRAIAGEALTVHGDGSQTRDFTFIDEAVEGTIRALAPAGRNETFNIGRGEEVSIRELANTVRSVIGKGDIRFVDHPRPYRVERRCADVSKAREKLGYEPTISLVEGIQRLQTAVVRESRV